MNIDFLSFHRTINLVFALAFKIVTHNASFFVGQGILKRISRGPGFESGYDAVDGLRCNNLNMLACFILGLHDDIFKP